MDNSELYEIQYIFGSQILENKMQYCVKWKNYPKSQKTWEPIENLGVHNISSVRRYQRHADYFLFYQFIYEEQVEGYRVHQKQNTFEKIKVIPDPQEDEQIDQANSDKLNTTLKETQNKDNMKSSIPTPKETTKKITRSTRKQIQQQQEDESHSDSKDSDFGKRSKKSRSKAKSSQSRKKSPNSAGDKSNQTQPKKSQLIKQEQLETDEINQVQPKSQERQNINDQEKQNDENLSDKSESPKQQPKVQTRLRNVKNQKSIEQIKTTTYFNQVRKLIQSLDEDEKSIVTSHINEKMKDNIFENLGALCILDYMQRRDQVFNEIKQQEYVQPLKGEHNLLLSNKQTKKNKKLEKSSIKMESQRSTDIACPPKSKRLIRLSAFEQKRKIMKKKDDQCHMTDFIASINQYPQFGIVSTEIDSHHQYGQIGFQIGEEITGHYYGINSNGIGKPILQLYFIMKFRREGDKTFLYNHVTQAECHLYEKDLLYDYVYKNQHLLPEMYNELIVKSVYNQQ